VLRKRRKNNQVIQIGKNIMSDENSMNVKFKALWQNRKVRELLPFLSFGILGILIAVILNSITPLSSSWVFFLFILVLLLILVIVFGWVYRDFMSLRILFLGASITSVLFAFHTFFFSIVGKFGIIGISLDSLVGLFRSVLLTSLFSFLERLTRFFEDQAEMKTRKN
jgi:hypothetical protein